MIKINFSRNKRIRHQQKLMWFFLACILACIPLSFISIKYLWYSFVAHYSEMMSAAANWDKDIFWVDVYRDFLEKKQSFIDSNVIASFYSSLNGSLFIKILQYILILSFASSPYIFYLLFDNCSNKIDKIRAEIKRRRRKLEQKH